MRIGDLVQLRWWNEESEIGMIVAKETFKNKWTIKTKYRVLWPSGDTTLHDYPSLVRP